jgi:hypothetical protein
MTTCERRIHALAHSRICVRAINRTSVQLQLLDTISCAIALFAWLAGAWHRANALFICRMREVEFNIMDIIGVTYAPRAYRTRFDPPLSIRRAGANAKDVPTHPHPPFRKQVLT